MPDTMERFLEVDEIMKEFITPPKIFDKIKIVKYTVKRANSCNIR